MNKLTLVLIFFITFLFFETLLYYIYRNKNTIKESFLLQKNQNQNKTTTKTSVVVASVKEPFLEAYQGSETNYESCKKNGYPHQWCLRIQEPYSIPNPDSLIECSQ